MPNNIIMADAKGGVDLTKPFYTYEFSIASDQNYQDETGTAQRTLVSWTPGQAFLDKVASYSIQSNVYPYNPDGRPRFLVSVRKKGTITPDATYQQCMRSDLECFFSSTNRYPPYLRARWRLKPDGTLVYGGGFTTAQELNGLELYYSNGTMSVKIQLSSTGVQMVAAGDYVVEFYDMTWTSLIGGGT